MKKIVVFTGAGMSAESGINTFRDSGGLWEQHRIENVATPEAFQRDPALVLDFYNQRRKQVIAAFPNEAHKSLVTLEEKFDVHIITQNIDDLHERAGSSKVLHLHGEIRKSRSSVDPSLIYNIDGWELKIGEKCEGGSQLRPYIVWFGEMVPAMAEAELITQSADIFIIIGTSLEVYPAANLVDHASEKIPKFLVDPNAKPLHWINNLEIIKEKAGVGIPALVTNLLNN